jgi:prepilin-type N-terminal cleavage/methylation domain-containing protein
MTVRENRHAFTLIEMLISMVIVALIVVFVNRLFSSAASVTTAGNKHIDCDLQARQVFDRMAIDLAQMVKRPDVDSYVKSDVDLEIGNDKIAFFSQVPGYYPSIGSQSPTSLVAYRVNSDSSSAAFNRMERMGKGLVWNAVSPTDKPVIFGLRAIFNNWPTATDDKSPDPDYETIGPQIFRFEYFYLLKDGSLALNNPTPGMEGVAAISVCIAVLDPKSKVLVSNAQISTLVGRMNDFSFSPSVRPGDLLKQWQTALDNTNDIPRPAISAIRLYQRAFYLLPKL